jgi:hypothetical protein
MNIEKRILNEGSDKEKRGYEKLNEGQEKGNNKIVITPRPGIEPAPQKPTAQPIAQPQTPKST